MYRKVVCWAHFYFLFMYIILVLMHIELILLVIVIKFPMAVDVLSQMHFVKFVLVLVFMLKMKLEPAGA